MPVTDPAAVLAEQRGYAARVRELAPSYFGKEPVAFVHTYGCQQNVSDSETLKGWLAEMGFSFSDTAENADFVLFNTCAVREHAEDRVFGNVGALKAYKRERPAMMIALCGCMVQQQRVADRFKKSFPYVDLLFGTHNRHRLPELIYRRMTGQGRQFDRSEDETVYEGLPIKRDGKEKVWLPIMQGCNNFCTYCIVPYVRGREHSRDPEAVLAEARELVAGGAKEIMLLGQNVNSYGKGEPHGVTFAELLRRVNAIEGDFRIRFMTSHPRDCTEELLLAMRDCGKVCKTLHLPVQSGSDRILSRMNRHYDTAHYLSLVKRARELMPDIALTSDLIVGFPDETEEDFEATLSLVREVRFRALFTFLFSPRPGTPAATMEDPVTDEEKSRRFGELLRVQEAIGAELAAARVGTRAQVLAEEYENGILTGKDEAGAVVTFPGTAEGIGSFHTVQITTAGNALSGIEINEQ